MSLSSGDSDERPSVETADQGHAERDESTPWPTQKEGVGQPDVVEVALADALTKAATAGQWETVSQLARELEARRRARMAVVDLEAERNRRRDDKR